jgi:hypothetical protein
MGVALRVDIRISFECFCAPQFGITIKRGFPIRSKKCTHIWAAGARLSDLLTLFLESETECRELNAARVPGV